MKIGLDIGSTTAKGIVINDRGEVQFSMYERHQADVRGAVSNFLRAVEEKLGPLEASVALTGSVGMGVAERLGLPFVQEVVAATRYVREMHPGISTIIDIGGEDAKIVFLKPGGNSDLRMNGNCAGGTGAFIDQMALLLGVDPDGLDALAAKAERRYPIASRCGVFSKTDVQNLMSKNVDKADIAASIFHAVAVQTIVTLSRGCDIKPKILFCGGPLTFISSLRKAFSDYLGLKPEDYVVPDKGNMVPAWGTALSAPSGELYTPARLLEMLENAGTEKFEPIDRLEPIFASETRYEEWKAEKANNPVSIAPLSGHRGDAWLGIDSGSTTTKIVVTDDQDRVIFSRYASNNGNPIKAVKDGLEELVEECSQAGVDLRIKGSCVTGYGEDLIKAAFGLDGGIIETIAHYLAARKIDPKVSFILDIGGQDMKAIFVDNGVLNRMELNEACSSGCGSFIETFARSLGYPLEKFAREACLGSMPCDLGTRCTVFMNSKVKQMLREGASIGDIAAGLSYSVIKNCLFKVLKLKKTEELGEHIVVQGGTMRNDSIVGALEVLTGAKVSRSSMPELMGAYGCALCAHESIARPEPVAPQQLLETAGYTVRQIQCHGCENVCYVHKYVFDNGNVFYSGNKCEKVFSNRGEKAAKGRNMSAEKYTLLFNRPMADGGRLTLGIPRSLNMFENYPFWQALFEACGIGVKLSSPSTFRQYEQGVHSVMSDNICFPAKLVHSHIYDLVEKRVDRIFFPYVVFEKQEGAHSRNSFNCPIVSGYSEVVKSAIDPSIPVDSPVITFKDRRQAEICCAEYLATLGVDKKTIKQAFEKAWQAQEDFERQIREKNIMAFEESRAAGKLTILLAGRPYHTDPLVQHKLSDMIADMGVTVITEDIVRGDQTDMSGEAHLVSQWAYINRILHAARWVAEQGDDVHFVQMTSFGCGPDAFLLDEVKTILNRRGKSLTLLKIDDVNNIGSIKLRVRSVVESLRFGSHAGRKTDPFLTTKKFTKEERHRTILIPYFTDYISPLIPSILELAGYKVEQLPESDAATVDYGLMYANNEVCYPATLVVGDLLKALDSGKYDLDNTAVIITQTGGQCRASNYIALIKKGIADAGYTQVPVLSMAFGSGLMNEQSGFTIPWARIMPVALAAILYGDCISKFYFASVVREKDKGAAMKLRLHYLDECKKVIATGRTKDIYKLIGEAAEAFDSIVEERELPKVGVVGEIFLKFNSFAHKNIVNWLVDQGVEVVPPILTDFFMQSFVNRKVKKQTHIVKSSVPEFLPDLAYSIVWSKIRKVNELGSRFRYFYPFHDIFKTAEKGKNIVTLSAQFGEGWLLPAEVAGYAEQGVNNVISLQPFGCIANHIVSKGVEKKIKKLYPDMNLLSLDFDSGVSDVNVTNRLMLMTNNLR